MLQTPGIVAGATGLEILLEPEKTALTLRADFKLQVEETGTSSTLSVILPRLARSA